MLEILAPTVCPECASPIVEHRDETATATTHWCKNEECPGRIADMLTFVAGRTLLEIEGLGPEMAIALTRHENGKAGYVVTLADLFEFSNKAREALLRVGPERFSEGMRKKRLPGAAMIKMIETVERAKTASWDRWIAALGIPMIGLTLGKTLAMELKLGSGDLFQFPVMLHLGEHVQIEGIGFHKRSELKSYAYSKRFQNLCVRLYQAGVRPTPLAQPVLAEGTPLAGMVFCITGECYSIGSRPFITKELEKLGAIAKTGVSKKLTHLIVGTEPGKTKLSKAAELKIPQLDEAWLEQTFQTHGVKTTGADTAMDWAD